VTAVRGLAVSLRSRLAAGAALLLMTGCVYVPVTTQVYDRECRIISKQMGLAPVQIGAIQHCRNEDCAVLLVAAGVTAAASAVVSGSIAIVGNVVYWFERLGQCAKAESPRVPDGSPS